MSQSGELADLLAQPRLLELLSELRRAASSAQPERDLVRLLVKLTDGGAEIRASWGAVVAAAGNTKGEGQTFRLQHGRRHVGRLTLWAGAEWAALGALAAEYALLARLQSAAAGSARRRVGERTLEALLSGTGQLGSEAYAVALADLGREAGSGARAQAAHAYALDVLAEVGEGYLAERGGLCTVWQGKALWWWPSHDPQAEGGELFAALSQSVGSVRVGISGSHRGEALSVALEEARQALAAVRVGAGGGWQTFQALDPLAPLLASEAAEILRAQVRTRLAGLEDAGKVEATLRAYFAHSGTLAALAEAQNVHVNTLRYRLKRAEDALGASLSDPATLARLYLALGTS